MIKTVRIQVQLAFIVGWILTFGSACEEKKQTVSSSTQKEKSLVPDSNYVSEVFLNYLPSISDGLELNREVESLGGLGYKIFLADLNDDSLIDAIVDYSLLPNFYGNAISEIGGLVYFKNTGNSLIMTAHWENLDGNFGSRNYVEKIENGIIYLDMFKYAQNDGRCCPSSFPNTTMVRIEDDEFVLR